MSCTDVPDAYDALQLKPQSMPAGELVTVPPPLGEITTDSVGLTEVVTHGPKVRVPDPGSSTVWSNFDGTSGWLGTTACGVGFSSAAKP